ncbi:TIGR04222 domain-containing membrane protein [Streptosporangium sp. NPDC003464]
MLTTLIVVVTVALVTVAGLIALRLAMHSPKVYRGPAPDLYELSQLAGGRFRVANTALAALAARGALTARRDGRLIRAAPPPQGIADPEGPPPPERISGPGRISDLEAASPPEGTSAPRRVSGPAGIPPPAETSSPGRISGPEGTSDLEGSSRLAGASHPVEAEILALLGDRPGGLPVWEVKAAVVRGPAVTALIAHMEGLGLVEACGAARVEPTRLGQAALVHHRLRHREEASLPPRPRDHVSRAEFDLCGIALYGLGRASDRELAAVLSLSGTPAPPASGGRIPPGAPAASGDPPPPTGVRGPLSAPGPQEPGAPGAREAGGPGPREGGDRTGPPRRAPGGDGGPDAPRGRGGDDR